MGFEHTTLSRTWHSDVILANRGVSFVDLDLFRQFMMVVPLDTSGVNLDRYVVIGCLLCPSTVQNVVLSMYLVKEY